MNEAPLQPFSFARWLDEHAHLLVPPVGNAQVFEHGRMVVMVVGGPNQRTDFHDDPVEEFFYQLEGDMVLRVMDAPGEPPRDIPIREGEVLLLPAHVRHSPQRPQAGSVGLVVESERPPGARDAFEWYCMRCHALVHRAEVVIESIVRDLPPLFERFHGTGSARTCPECGALHPGREWPQSHAVTLP